MSFASQRPSDTYGVSFCDRCLIFWPMNDIFDILSVMVLIAPELKTKPVATTINRAR